MTKRFVIDTNSLISAFLLEKSVSRFAYDRARAAGTIVLSSETYREFGDVFIRPKFDRYVALSKRQQIIEDIQSVAVLLEVTKTITACRDPKDDKFLLLAVSVGASIITGDQDLLVLHPFQNIPILTPANFLQGADDFDKPLD